MGTRNFANISLASSMRPLHAAAARRFQRMLYGALTVLGVLAQCVAAAPAARGETPGWQETTPALHTVTDARRNRVWVLQPDAVYLFDAATRQLLERVELPGWSFASESFSRAPDLALAPSGAALVTSNVIPTIWEIDPQLLVVRQHRLSLDADNDKDVGFTTLAFSQNGHTLFGFSSLLGSVWTIDLAGDIAHKVAIARKD